VTKAETSTICIIQVCITIKQS